MEDLVLGSLRCLDTCVTIAFEAAMSGESSGEAWKWCHGREFLDDALVRGGSSQNNSTQFQGKRFHRPQR